MAKAVWNGVIIAESDETVIVEGSEYFPPSSIDRMHLEGSVNQTVCPWKGVASYFDVVVDGKRNVDAAWYYPVPSSAAAEIKDHVAFWKGVSVEA